MENIGGDLPYKLVAFAVLFGGALAWHDKTALACCFAAAALSHVLLRVEATEPDVWPVLSMVAAVPKGLLAVGLLHLVLT